MKASVYGRNVSLPDLVELPLADATSDAIDLHVSIGSIADSELSFALDDAVMIHLADRRVSVEPLIELGPRALEHYVVDHAVPVGLVRRGDVVIHCAGIAKGHNGVVLLGESGQGKSTTSMHLAQAGWSLLGDDSVRVSIDGNQPLAWASYPGLRLHPDMIPSLAGPLVAEYANKRRLFFNAQQQTTPVGLLVVLGGNSDFSVSPIGPAERCAVIANHTFFPPGDASDALWRLDIAMPLATRLAGVRIDFPRTLDGVRRVVEFLERWAAGEAG